MSLTVFEDAVVKRRVVNIAIICLCNADLAFFL